MRDALRDWARGLGIDTYVGSFRPRVPDGSQGRAAAARLGASPARQPACASMCTIAGWAGTTPAHCGSRRPKANGPSGADAIVLALGGGSWPQLGSDGAWVPLLRERGVDVAPLQPSNCGFDVGWSAHFAQRHAGAPLKPVVAHWRDATAASMRCRANAWSTATGVEGSLVYALSAGLRDAIARDGSATLHLDLAPGRDAAARARANWRSRAPAARSANTCAARPASTASRRGCCTKSWARQCGDDRCALAATIKRLPLGCSAPRPLDEAISSAGGVRLEALDENTDAARDCRACSAPAKCSTGKRRPAATC